MGWQVGYDEHWKRDIGYDVVAFCDHPRCERTIDRGLAYVCGGEPKGGDKGCGLYFCREHLGAFYQQCPRCRAYKPPYARIKPEHPRWIAHKLTDESWAEWRAENPAEVEAMKKLQGVPETPETRKL